MGVEKNPTQKREDYADSKIQTHGNRSSTQTFSSFPKNDREQNGRNVRSV